MKQTRKAFTLVELTLAIAFLSLLLLSVAYVTMNITGQYQKGLSIKAVSSTGRELITEFSRTIAASPVKPATGACDRAYAYSAAESSPYQRCLADKAYLLSYQQYQAAVEDGKGPVPVSGVFCTGRYSYLWNTGYTLNEENYPLGGQYRASFQYGGGTVEGYHLLVVTDPDREVCLSNLEEASYATKGVPTVYKAEGISAKPEELLAPSEDNLALYDFTIFRPRQHFLTGHSFYSGTFILATVAGGVDITGTGNYCTETPDDLSTDFNYCAINKFNFAMRATGELHNDD